MTTTILAALLLGLAAAGPARAAAKLRIVTTIPDLADMTERVGGNRVSVQSLARGPEDIHQIVMRPSFVTRLNRADAVVYLGLTAEHSFLPGLLEAARNPKLRADPSGSGCAGEGCVDCSKGVSVLETPDSLSRSEGEIHPLGNPHYHMGADNAPRMARNIAEALKRLDPEHKAEYEANLKAYLAELEGKLVEWRRKAAVLKGVKAVSYHKDVAYLGRFTGIDFVDTLEAKPGIAPTPTHLEALVRKMKAEKVALIVREQQYESKSCEWLARQTGARIAVIGTMVNALRGADTYVKTVDRNLDALIAAVEGGGR